MSFVFGCDENIDISLLKNNGYIETSCNKVERYEENNLRFIEVNKPLESKRDFILARCFNNNSCIFDVMYDREKITCQRYILDFKKERQYLESFSNIEYREFLDHRVLYFLISENK